MKARTSQSEQPTIQPHLSRIVRIINLGLQPGFIWEGEEIEAEYKIDFTFEILDENMRDGRPFWVSKDVNNMDSVKGNLYKYVTAAGATCDSVELALTKAVSMTPRLKKSGWSTVDSVSGLPPSLAGGVPQLVNEPIFFDFTEDGTVPVSIEPVGNYAISILWSDGHSAGIYRFDFLRELEARTTAAPSG